jgi:DNA invertase Pin-like site-specific DNA recombinase
MRDIKQKSFSKIARLLGVSVDTVTRAYDHARPAAVREAAERGERPRRGRYSHLGPEVHERIREGFVADERPEDVARAAGCSVQTVYRLYSRMRSSA